MNDLYWRGEQEKTSDRISEFKDTTPAALETIEDKDFAMNEDGTFKDEKLRRFIEITLLVQGRTVDDFLSMSEAERIKFAIEAGENVLKTEAGLAAEFDLEGEIAQVFEEHGIKND